VSIEAYNSFYSQNWQLIPTQDSLIIDITSQANVVYYVKFLLKDGTFISKKIIKQKKKKKNYLL